MKPVMNPRAVMDPKILLGILAMAAVLATCPSCVVAVGEPMHDVDGAVYQEDMFYTDAPPPPQAEVIVGAAPAPDYIWVGGYWTRHRDSWFWIRGRWSRKPHATAEWVGGHWDRHPRGYAYTPGRWR